MWRHWKCHGFCYLLEYRELLGKYYFHRHSISLYQMQHFVFFIIYYRAPHSYTCTCNMDVVVLFEESKKGLFSCYELEHRLRIKRKNIIHVHRRKRKRKCFFNKFFVKVWRDPSMGIIDSNLLYNKKCTFKSSTWTHCQKDTKIVTIKCLFFI